MGQLKTDEDAYQEEHAAWKRNEKARKDKVIFNIASIMGLNMAFGSGNMFGPAFQGPTWMNKGGEVPKFASGEISAFALTEDNVGSDPSKVETLAEPTEDGDHFIINGTKLWCTNGVKANVIIVMAKTPDKNGNKRKRKKSESDIFSE